MCFRLSPVVCRVCSHSCKLAIDASQSAHFDGPEVLQDMQQDFVRETIHGTPQTVSPERKDGLQDETSLVHASNSRGFVEVLEAFLRERTPFLAVPVAMGYSAGVAT